MHTGGRHGGMIPPEIVCRKEQEHATPRLPPDGRQLRIRSGLRQQKTGFRCALRPYPHPAFAWLRGAEIGILDQFES